MWGGGGASMRVDVEEDPLFPDSQYPQGPRHGDNGLLKVMGDPACPVHSVPALQVLPSARAGVGGGAHLVTAGVKPAPPS